MFTRLVFKYFSSNFSSNMRFQGYFNITLIQCKEIAHKSTFRIKVGEVENVKLDLPSAIKELALFCFCPNSGGTLR